MEEFIQALEDALSAPPPVQTSVRDGNTSRILSIKLPCLHSARDKSVDWFKAYSKEMLPVIEEKRCALAMYKSSPSACRHSELLGAKFSKQLCANDDWLQLCSKIQISVEAGNVKGMYNRIKQAIDPMQDH